MQGRLLPQGTLEIMQIAQALESAVTGSAKWTFHYLLKLQSNSRSANEAKVANGESRASPGVWGLSYEALMTSAECTGLCFSSQAKPYLFCTFLQRSCRVGLVWPIVQLNGRVSCGERSHICDENVLHMQRCQLSFWNTDMQLRKRSSKGENLTTSFILFLVQAKCERS